MTNLNKNIAQLKPSATLAINSLVSQKRDEGAEVIHFGFGQSPFPVHPSIVEALCNNANNNKYLNTQGLLPLRNAISSFLYNHQKVEAKPENIFISPGSKTFLYQSILLLDTTFLIPRGSWVSYVPQIHTKGGKYTIIPTSGSNDYKVSGEDLRKICVSGQSYTLILNSPNNPTGAVYLEEELKDIAAVCREYDITVISDEIYSQLHFTEEYAPSISRFLPEKTLVLGGLSKVFSAGGYRLGFMVVPENMSSFSILLKALISETFSCVSSPIQYAAIEAYNFSPSIQAYVHQQRNILQYIGRFVYSRLTQAKLNCTYPQGGFYLVVDFEHYRPLLSEKGIYNAQDLCNTLITQIHVALLPGQDFYFDENSLACRLAFVDFNGEEALNHLKGVERLEDDYLVQFTPNIYYGVLRIIEYLEGLMH